ncbi:hypothetical protein PIB30_003293 [Stylosanthes scabra]|uniref:Aminotransferase-like plant mobile domain-containing protein n=1 Tax=Stylosanthes scabra TaxID=79078 RepID=A0ABU6S2R6_9FABA|nr:hypothetical protein [Stylosanthes scabra]
MPWSECTIILEDDVAYQLGLPIDGEPVSGCLWDFENMMPEGTGRPRWDWFPSDVRRATRTAGRGSLHRDVLMVEEHLQSSPRPSDRQDGPYTCQSLHVDVAVDLSFRGQDRSLGSCSLASLSAAHRRSRSIQLGVRSASLSVQESVSSSQQECRPDGRAVGSAAELDFLAVSPLIRREGSPTAASQEATRFDALQRVRMSPISDVGGRGGARPTHSAGGTQSPLVLDRPTYILWDHQWHQVDQVIPQFGGVQNRPHPALNIDFLHAKDGRGSDQWFPQSFQRWHALWATRYDFIQWWILAGRRFLVPADRFHHLPPDEIPVEAAQRQSGPHLPRPDVSHVPDNRRLARRMMVGTRTTARDWQWLDDMMAEDAPVAPLTQKNMLMPVSYACRRGTGRPRRGGRAGRGRGEGVTRRLPSRLRAVPAPVRR